MRGNPIEHHYDQIRQWASEGKTDAQMAELLNASPSGVREIRRKYAITAGAKQRPRKPKKEYSYDYRKEHYRHSNYKPYWDRDELAAAEATFAQLMGSHKFLAGETTDGYPMRLPRPEPLYGLGGGSLAHVVSGDD